MARTEYDPRIIQKCADKLYSRARIVVVLAAITGMMTGGIAAFYIYVAFSSGALASIGFTLLVLISIIGGNARALQLKLEAQTSLCQMMIEDNTRALSEQLAGAMRKPTPSRQPK
jgi:hypothetical protein